MKGGKAGRKRRSASGAAPRKTGGRGGAGPGGGKRSDPAKKVDRGKPRIGSTREPDDA